MIEMGFEPTTIGLKGQRSTFWAKWALLTINIFTVKKEIYCSRQGSNLRPLAY